MILPFWPPLPDHGIPWIPAVVTVLPGANRSRTCQIRWNRPWGRRNGDFLPMFNRWTWWIHGDFMVWKWGCISIYIYIYNDIYIYKNLVMGYSYCNYLTMIWVPSNLSVTPLPKLAEIACICLHQSVHVDFMERNHAIALLRFLSTWLPFHISNLINYPAGWRSKQPLTSSFRCFRRFHDAIILANLRFPHKRNQPFISDLGNSEVLDGIS